MKRPRNQPFNATRRIRTIRGTRCSRVVCLLILAGWVCCTRLFAGGIGGTECWIPGEPPVGPDLIVSDLQGVQRYAEQDGIEALSVGFTSCNIGSRELAWISSTDHHPISTQNLFRLHDGRFEQMGQSWVLHEFLALNFDGCGCECTGQAGSQLAIGCSTVNSASIAGVQSLLSPKSEVNASTGRFPYPSRQGGQGQSGDSVYKRLQVNTSDLDPLQNDGAIYFVEVQHIAPDDAAASNQDNNASYRGIRFGEGPFGARLIGTTQRGRPGIRAWKDHDPEVLETDVQVPADGLLILAAKATDLGTGLWHYEYAIQNLNSHRSVASLGIPIGANTLVQAIGFHDVDDHSGEPFDGTDWSAKMENGVLTWSTEPFDVNPNAHALRWGTLYNFRFEADRPPARIEAAMGLFLPGDPESVSASTIGPACGLYGDVAPPGGDGRVDMDDFLCALEGFMNQYNCPQAELDPCAGDGFVDVDDILAMLDALEGFYECPHPCPS